MLTMAAFDNALGLPEGVNLCLAFQHHLISMSYVQGGKKESRTSSAMLNISEPGLLYIKEFANMRYTSLRNSSELVIWPSRMRDLIVLRSIGRFTIS